MAGQLPSVLRNAIDVGLWKNPGPDVLRRILGVELELPDLELFEDVEVIGSVYDQVDTSGFIEEPEFCMVRDAGAFQEDPRLVFESALFVAGSIMPGDDVLVAVDLRGDSGDLRIRVLDWRQPVPHRWVDAGTLSRFVAALSAGPTPGRF